jgi:hypothetical protein
VEEMATDDFPYLKVNTPEKERLAGKRDKGTRIWRRQGTYKESGEWCIAADDVFDDQFVSPGGVSMFVPVSRAAVYKRLSEGRLTALCFHVVHDEKTFFGKVRKAKATPFVFIPVSECQAWAEEIVEKRGPVETVGGSDVGDRFLVCDPADHKDSSVRYTDKYVDKDREEWIRREMEENLKEQSKRNKKEAR